MTTASPFEMTDPDEVGLDPDRLARIPQFFQSYLDQKRLPMVATLVARDGKVAHLSHAGGMSMEEGAAPIAEDAIYRVYSMTKPVTSAAIMMLYEEGKLQLSDPVARFIPAFGDMQVMTGGTADAPEVTAAKRLITVHDLLTHTSGLTYSFLYQLPTDEIYRKKKLDPFAYKGDLASFAEEIASAPLVFSPKDGWNYSVSTDILGRIVEVVSGMKLSAFFEERIFKPLGMVDTGFYVPEEKLSRLPTCYRRDIVRKETVLADPGGDQTLFFGKPPSLEGGGGGLVSTIADYYRFCCMLANGGQGNGHLILSPKTVEFMTENHLPGGKTIAEMGDKTFSEARMDGAGFGLGFSVTTDPVAGQQVSSVGSFSWGGLASTFFWIDPMEDLIVIQMTQCMPSSVYPIRPQLQQLVYASIAA